MISDVKNHCKSCLGCASRKKPPRASRAALCPIPVAGPFDRVATDFLGPLPLTERGNRYIIVFTEYLTKWVEAFATPDTTAITTAKCLVEGVVCRHSAPNTLLSDRGTNYTSNLVRENCKLFDIKKQFTSAYHPQTDGLTERFNKTLCTMLSMYTSNTQKDWDQFLPYCLFAYNTAPQSSTEFSPFSLLYGRSPRLPIDQVLVPQMFCYTIDLDDYYLDLKDYLSMSWKLAQNNISKAQLRYKKQ